MPQTYTYTIVNDPDGTFRVHRKGCADIMRRGRFIGVRSGDFAAGTGQHDVEAESVEAAVVKDLRELNESYGGSSGYDESYWVVLPCAWRARA